jgi:acetyl-CoA carboxylase biotin carboxyl carrier protein
VRCPLTGVWYDAPAPGAAPFVRAGDFVTIGAVIGLLETMKVFNEVHADVAGIVRQVLAHRGELVMAHAPLITVEPSGITTIEGLA